MVESWRSKNTAMARLFKILLLLFTRWSVLQAVKTIGKVQANAGETVTIPCFYDQIYDRHVKYWCRGKSWNHCTTLARTDSHYSPQVLIRDDPSNHVFTVTMRNLRTVDAALYWCAVEIKRGGDDKTYIMLTVNDGVTLVKTVPYLTVRRGSTVTIPCFYDKTYTHNGKYLCRGGSWDICETKAHTKSAGQLSIMDDPNHHIFSVTKKNVQRYDNDIYWCAVEIHGGGDDGEYTSIIVTEAVISVLVVNNSVSVEEGSNVTIQCLYPPQLRGSQKKWCRADSWTSCLTSGGTELSLAAAVQISDGLRGVFSVTMTELRKRDTGWYWCTAGEERFPVHINVTVKMTVSNTTVLDKDDKIGELRTLDFLPKGGVCLLYLICTIIAVLNHRGNLKSRGRSVHISHINMGNERENESVSM